MFIEQTLAQLLGKVVALYLASLNVNHTDMQCSLPLTDESLTCDKYRVAKMAPYTTQARDS